LTWEALGDYHGPPSFRFFARYLIAKWRRKSIEDGYRAYVAESLRLAPQMRYLQRSWADVIRQDEPDNRSAEEIVDGVISRIEEVS